MSNSGCLHNLIADVRLILHADRTPRDISFWREPSVLCLRRLPGPDRHYTRLLEILVQLADKSNLLTAAGILADATEEVYKISQDADYLKLMEAIPSSV